MKEFLYVLLCSIFVLCSAVVAEEKLGDDVEGASKDVENGWKVGGMVGVNLNQSAYKNWSAGGENSYSATGLFNLNWAFKNDVLFWTNSFDLKYGRTKQADDESQKTDDKIELVSQFGRKAFANWYYSAYLSAKSQMTEGFEVDDNDVEEKISNLFSPLYVVLALGLDKEIVKNFSVLLSPISGKTTIVMDQDLSDIGAYGVKIGKHYKNEIGAYIKAQYKINIMTNTDFETKLNLFADYLDKPQNIDVEWSNLLTLKVNDFLNTNISFDLVYDDDVLPEVQLKEVLSVGLSYKF